MRTPALTALVGFVLGVLVSELDLLTPTAQPGAALHLEIPVEADDDAGEEPEQPVCAAVLLQQPEQADPTITGAFGGSSALLAWNSPRGGPPLPAPLPVDRRVVFGTNVCATGDSVGLLRGDEPVDAHSKLLKGQLLDAMPLPESAQAAPRSWREVEARRRVQGALYVARGRQRSIPHSAQHAVGALAVLRHRAAFGLPPLAGVVLWAPERDAEEDEEAAAGHEAWNDMLRAGLQRLLGDGAPIQDRLPADACFDAVTVPPGCGWSPRLHCGTAEWFLEPADAAALTAAVRDALPAPPPPRVPPLLLAANETETGGPVLLFVQRRGSREVLGLQATMEAAARAVGGSARAVALEDLPLWQQIDEFAAADVVVAPHGAGTTNAMWMRPCSALLELFPWHYFLPGFYGPLARGVGALYDYMYDDAAASAPACAAALPNPRSAQSLYHCRQSFECRQCARTASIRLDPAAVASKVAALLSGAAACRARVAAEGGQMTAEHARELPGAELRYEDEPGVQWDRW